MLETRLRSFGDNTGGSASSVVYAPTGGTFIVYTADPSLVSEKILTASNNVTITTDATAIYISANTGTGGTGTSFSIPLIVTSGGTGLNVAGSGTMLAGMNSSGVTYDYYLLQGSNNATVVRNGTSYQISATTANISGKQDSLTIPLSTGSGGTGRTTIGSAHTLLGVNSSEATLSYYAILASNNAVVTKVGTSIFITANTSDISGKQNSISIPLIIGSGGTGRSTAGSAHTLLGVNSDGTTLSYYAILASNNTVVTKVGTAVFISANTVTYAATGNSYVVIGLAGDLTAERTIAADTGLTLTDGGAGGNITYSVNSNIRDRIFSFFAPLSLSTAMSAEEIRFRIPFACQPIRCDLAVTSTTLLIGVTCDLLQFSNPAAAAGTTIFSTSANKPQLLANSSTGNTTTFDTAVLHAGSFLGMRILQVGSATAQGSNLTLTLVVRTS